MNWKNIYRGIFMGISDLIPGVSGSTIAVILGIYDQFLHSINQFFSRDWKKSLPFLFPLGIGIGCTFIFFSKIISYLLHNFQQPTQFFFLGLIVGVIPLLFKMGEVKQTFTWKHCVMVVVCAVIVASLGYITPKSGFDASSLTTSKIVLLFFSGWLASMAMLLPGISGSFVLVVIGVYSVVIDALANLNVTIIVIVGLGAVVGFIVSSRIIGYLLDHHHHMTFAAIIGLVLGSLLVIYPGIPTVTSLLIASICTFIIGLVTVTFLNNI